MEQKSRALKGAAFVRVEILLAPEQFQKQLDHCGIEMLAALFANILQRLFFGLCLAIRAIRDEGIVDVCNGEDAGGQRDLLPPQAAGVFVEDPMLCGAASQSRR